jgi:hypothetical protein
LAHQKVDCDWDLLVGLVMGRLEGRLVMGRLVMGRLEGRLVMDRLEDRLVMGL